MTNDSGLSGRTTAIERRGLIALAIILVVSVAAIAVWRGDTASKHSGTVPGVDTVAVAAIERAARADSIASSKGSKRNAKVANRNKKTTKSRKATALNRRSPLDENPD